MGNIKESTQHLDEHMLLEVPRREFPGYDNWKQTLRELTEEGAVWGEMSAYACNCKLELVGFEADELDSVKSNSSRAFGLKRMFNESPLPSSPGIEAAVDPC